MHLPYALLTVALLAAAAEQGPRVAVLTIDLNNLHKTPPDSAFPERLARLGGALRERLGTCGYELVTVEAAAEAAAQSSQGYLYDHPDVAAELARSAGAEWVIVPRLNRASAWAADLQAHVVRAGDGAIVSNRIVELKGLELTPELAERLSVRGAAWMADQLAQAIDYAEMGNGEVPRRCPP